MAELSKKEKDYYLRRLSQLKLEQSSFISHWKELSEYLEPRSGRFFLSDRNNGGKRHNKIINGRGTQALRSSQSGIFAGVMSPTRPWFKLEPINQELMAVQGVKEWLYKVETVLRAIFLDSNLYSAAPIMLGETLLFGTGAMAQLDDFESVSRFTPYTCGSYYITQNDRGVVDTFVIERERTVKQIVDEFGIDNVSVAIKSHYDRCEYDVWYRICQFIDPNPDYVPGDERSDKLPFRSVWFELGSLSSTGYGNNSTSTVITDNKFLRKSGFHEFPVHVVRWSVTGDDIYATNCPGMVALGDVKALQIMEKRKAQAIDKLVNPPLKGPPSLIDVPVNSLPGGMTIYDSDTTKEGLAPIYQVAPQVNDLRMDMQAIEQRINEAFFVDLFLAISTMEGIQPKNQLELSQRNAERLLMLGPPLERIQQEFLGQVIHRTFNQAMRANILPPPPPELDGQNLNISFISALAQAQRASEVSTIERTAMFIGQLAQLNPSVLDKFNADEAAEKYAHYVGVVPSVIVPQEQVEATRQARAEQQQKLMEAEMAAQEVKTIREGVDAADVVSSMGANNG